MAKPASLESTVTPEMTILNKSDVEVAGHTQYSNETNVNMSSQQSYVESQPHLGYEERYQELKTAVSEVEQRLSTKIKELENCLNTYKSELERLNKEMQSNSKYTLRGHVVMPKQTICYCYAQIGMHSHYIVEKIQ